MYTRKRKMIYIIAAILIIFLIIIISIICAARKNNLNNAIHAVTIDENVIFYKKAKTEDVKIYKTLELGTEVYVLEEFEDDGVSWSKVSVDGKKGYILSDQIRKLSKIK